MEFLPVGARRPSERTARPGRRSLGEQAAGLRTGASGLWPSVRDPQRRGRTRLGACHLRWGDAAGAGPPSSAGEIDRLRLRWSSRALARRLSVGRGADTGVLQRGRSDLPGRPTMMRPVYDDLRLAALFLGAAVALFLLPLTLQPTAFPFAPGAAYSDALIAHLSSARFLHRSVVLWGELPLWNPTVLSGLPFAADPLSGLWYPPFWLLALVPEAVVINLLLWAHLFFGGYGMFRLLRSEKLGGLAGLTGALAFAGMPKLVGPVGLGHLRPLAG